MTVPSPTPVRRMPPRTPVTPAALARQSTLVTLVTLAAIWCAAAMGAPPARGAEPDPAGAWPLDPRPEVVSTFDPPDDPWGAGHRGVDLAGRVGQPVRAALPGKVTFAGRIAGKPVVTVSHGDTRTTYEPVVARVEVGTPVTAGAVIGVLDLPASHCFPDACLHWGWLRGEIYLDPLDLVGGGPVRLLPLWRDRPVAAAASGAWQPPDHPYAGWSAPAVADRWALPPTVGVPLSVLEAPATAEHGHRSGRGERQSPGSRRAPRAASGERTAGWLP